MTLGGLIRFSPAATTLVLAAAMVSACDVVPVHPPAPGSADSAPGYDLAAKCQSVRLECSIDLSLPPAGGGASGRVHGRLTPNQPSRVYRFCIATAESLRWQWKGAAMHLVLQDPSGGVEGPGIPDPIRLALPGSYRLSDSADTMADDSFGEFSLTPALDP